MLTTVCKDIVILNQWHPISSVDDLENSAELNTILLEENISFKKICNDNVLVWRCDDPIKKLSCFRYSLFIILLLSTLFSSTAVTNEICSKNSSILL
mgnify:CR=1 FL=1